MKEKLTSNHFENKKIQDALSCMQVSSCVIEEVRNMKSLTEVIEQTGLKKGQISLYIKEGLLHPNDAALKHFKAGVLTEGEIEQLNAIVILRTHDFGLEEISYLSISGEKTADFLQKKSEKKLILYTNMEDVQQAIHNLQANAPDGKELEKLKKKLRNYSFFPKDPDYKPSFLERHLESIILTGMIFLLLLILYSRLPSLALRVLAILFFMSIGALLSIGGGIMYLIKRKPPKDYSYQTVAKIGNISSETGFNTSFAMGKSVVPGSGFREQGNPGLWQIFFMFWNNIRPDKYYPLVKFAHNGEERIATLRYGGYKHTWKESDQMEIFYSEEDNGLVYTRETSYLAEKGMSYLILGFILAGLVCWKITPVFDACNSNYVSHNLFEILNWVGDDVFEGTETVTDTEITLEISDLTGQRVYRIDCQEGDVITIEQENHLDNDSSYCQVQLKKEIGQLIPYDHYFTEDDSLWIWYYKIPEDGAYYLTVEGCKVQGRVHLTIER